MLGLFVVVLSVALAVVLLLVAFSYGADIVDHASSATAASALVVQATQIYNAVIFAQSEGLVLANGATPTLDARYLAKLPSPPLMAYAEGAPKGNDWTYQAAPDKALVLPGRISTQTCQAVNQRQGFIGIPSTVVPGMASQCFGEAEPFTFYFRTSGFDAMPFADKSLQLEALPGSTLCPDGHRIEVGKCSSAAAARENSPASLLRHGYETWVAIARKIFA